MKRIFRVIPILLIILTITITLAGCGGDVETKGVDTAGNSQAAGNQEAEDSKSKEIEEDYYFDGETAEIKDLKVKITGTKVIQPGEEGNEYFDKPVFAIWYEATNKSDKEVDAGTAWIVMFNMIQDNNDNFINELDVGMLPDFNHLDTQSQIIKKGGTVESSIAYELDDEVTPVTLIATRGIGGEEIGRYDYKLD